MTTSVKTAAGIRARGSTIASNEVEGRDDGLGVEIFTVGADNASIERHELLQLNLQ